jgi:hypothetical protein
MRLSWPAPTRSDLFAGELCAEDIEERVHKLADTIVEPARRSDAPNYSQIAFDCRR